MPKLEVSTKEARLIAVYRAVDVVNQNPDIQGILDPAEAGGVLEALEATVDLDELDNDPSFTAPQMKALLRGFVAGISASRLASLAAEGVDLYDDEQIEEQLPDEIASETISGGPTGGVVAGQEAGDPRYVKQTGPKD